MAGLVVANNHLEACRNWQEVINAQPSIQDKDVAGQEAMRSLVGGTYYDTRKVIVGGDVAMFFPDGIDRLEESLYPVVQFGEMAAQGWLGRLSYKRLKQEGMIVWSLYDPKVLGPTLEDTMTSSEAHALFEEDEPTMRLPVGTSLRRPLHFPVGLINYALCYEN